MSFEMMWVEKYRPKGAFDIRENLAVCRSGVKENNKLYNPNSYSIATL